MTAEGGGVVLWRWAAEEMKKGRKQAVKNRKSLKKKEKNHGHDGFDYVGFLI